MVSKPSLAEGERLHLGVAGGPGAAWRASRSGRPGRSPRPTLSTSAVTWETASCASNSAAPLLEQRHLVGQRHRRPDRSRTSSSTCTSPCEGSGASSTRPPPARAVTRAVSMALRTRLAASVGRDVDRGGEPDCAIDHDPHAHAELGVVGRAFGCGVAEADTLGADALDPQLGVACSRRRWRSERAASVSADVGGKRHQSPPGRSVVGIIAPGRSPGRRRVEGWRMGRPAAT